MRTILLSTLLFFLTSIGNCIYSQNYSGYYSGINKQEIGMEYPIEVIIEESNGKVLGSINYSTLECKGSLNFTGKTFDKRYFFKENLTVVNTCIKNGSVVLEFINENTAVFYWYYADGKLGSATVLRKSNYSKTSNSSCQYPIELYGDGSGVFEVATKLNNSLSISFILDSGASEVSITPDVATTLIRTGTISKNDWLEGKIYQFADGRTAKSDRFNLKSLQIGGYVLNNVSVSISNSIEAPLLLGQNVLSRLGKISIDYEKNVLCVEKK